MSLDPFFVIARSPFAHAQLKKLVYITLIYLTIILLEIFE
ncbi:2536_t:CDS:2 [Entrophospora sp. SA101]|nr:2536_t:CDS:2 [Entrophospora sp. SA101]